MEKQVKIRIKEHETDSKVDFRKKSGKKKKDKISGLLEHLKKKNIKKSLMLNGYSKSFIEK